MNVDCNGNHFKEPNVGEFESFYEAEWVKNDDTEMESKLNVSLITHTPDPELVVAAAAKLCYSSSEIHEIMERLTPDNIKKFIEMLTKMGHESPFEHISFTFGIEGVSRSLTHQLVRHRIGVSYSQKSQRYVQEGQFSYVVPPQIKAHPEAYRRYIKAMEYQQQAYDQLTELLIEENYRTLINQGVSNKEARSAAQKQSIEDARYVLPNACETKIIVTMNARALFNFVQHRCCNRAQWEIRNLAIEMLKLVKQVAPNVFKYTAPNCVYGSCTEGKMSCGKAKEMREYFINLN